MKVDDLLVLPTSECFSLSNVPPQVGIIGPLFHPFFLVLKGNMSS